MKRLALCVALLAGCSSKGDPTDDPPVQESQHEQEKNDTENRLRDANDLMGEAIAARDKLAAEPTPDAVRRGQALFEVFKQYEDIQKRDGSETAAKFYHGELVGKSLDEVMNKWQPKN